MGIIIDLIIIGIIALSAFLGYKKGLVKLGARLFAGIIAIILTLIVYKPTAEMIIEHTTLDEKIENIILENTPNFSGENTQLSNMMLDSLENEIIPKETKNISKNIVYAITGIVLFIVVKLVLSIVISLMDFVANLPILKQFNEVGGIIYGLVRGVLIVGICVLLMEVITKLNPESSLNEKIDNSYITKIIYNNIIKF